MGAQVPDGPAAPDTPLAPPSEERLTSAKQPSCEIANPSRALGEIVKRSLTKSSWSLSEALTLTPSHRITSLVAAASPC